jgi:hypothetical protein
MEGAYISCSIVLILSTLIIKSGLFLTPSGYIKERVIKFASIMLPKAHIKVVSAI